MRGERECVRTSMERVCATETKYVCEGDCVWARE